MKISLSRLVSALSTFWDFVRDLEHEVSVNFDSSTCDPAARDDFWIDAFEKAYDDLSVAFGTKRRKRSFPVPMGLPFHTGPLFAESAHQALLFFLNCPVYLYGQRHVLSSPEYVAIKKAAQAEVVDLQTRCLAPPKSKKPWEKRVRRAQLNRILACIEHHHLEGQKVDLTPLTSQEIADEIGFSQATASRRMHELFVGPIRKGEPLSGMDAYVAIWVPDQPRRGYKEKIEEAKGRVQAIYLHEFPDLDAAS